MTTLAQDDGAHRMAWLGRRRPTVLGLLVAGLSISELASGAVGARVEQSLLIALPVFVYITAAVIGRAWTAWPVLVAAMVGLVLLRSTDVLPGLGLSVAAVVAAMVVSVVICAAEPNPGPRFLARSGSQPSS